MNEKNAKFLEAATRVFLRYGFAKTTMSDIAQEAGVSRQTLYNAYPGKVEILRGAVQVYIRSTMVEVEQAWSETDDLGEALDAFFKLGPIYWFDIQQSNPDAADLFDGMHSAAKEEMQHASDLWTQMFSKLLRDHAPDLDNIPQVAEFIYSTSINAKHNAETRQIVLDRLDILRTAALLLVKAER